MATPKRVPFNKRNCVYCHGEVLSYTGSFYKKDPNQTRGPGKGWSVIHDHCRHEIELREEANENRLFNTDDREV